jgi:S-layer family protein
MRERRFGIRLFSAALLALIGAGAAGAQATVDQTKMPLLTTRHRPEEFGTTTDTVTSVSAMSFVVESDDVGYGPVAYFTSNGLGRFCQPDAPQSLHYYAGLNIPAGAVIDFIGLETATDTDAVIGVGLWYRGRNGFKYLVTGFSAPAHNWDEDFAGPLNISWSTNAGQELVLDVEQAPSHNYQYFAWVSVYWHRRLSPSPATATFSDVPTTHPFFRAIEALNASGITGGCGNGNFCPDKTVTRGEVAKFLAVALGLQWPN